VTDDASAFEALSDCVACGVEAAVVELIATRAGAGVVLESRCRLCLRELREGALVHPGERYEGEPGTALRALARWAAAENDPDHARFVLAHFGGLGPEEVAARLSRGERVETSFDAIAWLFPGIGAVGGGGDATPPLAPGGAPEPAHPVARASLHPTTLPPTGLPPVLMRRTSVPPSIPLTHESVPLHKQPLRVSARALCAVMLADGEASEADRSFLSATLARWGHPPLREDDLAVWRPHDLGWPHDPQAVVEAMAGLAFADGERDATEWRVTREFARAWGVSLDALEALGARLEREHQRGVRRLVSRVVALFVR
jgi:hypothetical protein